MMGIIRYMVVLFFAAAVSASSLAADLWYEDNNLGSPRGMPADFVEKFRSPDSFRQATGLIRVYLVRANVLERLDDQFLGTVLAAYLKENRIRLAMDAGGATWAQMSARVSVFHREIALLERLKGLGIEVHHISLQSVLSKPLRIRGERVDYPLDKRLEDVVAYAKAARAVYPGVEIGIIDALPTHGAEYKEPYRRLKDALSRENIGLGYIHVDMPFDLIHDQRRGASWRTLREVERFVEDELNLRFGLLATTAKGGRSSGKAFHEGVMSMLECYRGMQGTPGDFIIASWFAHPVKTIPETASGDDYPAMRTVLEFGRRLDQMKKSGMSGPARPDRPAQCGVGFPQ